MKNNISFLLTLAIFTVTHHLLAQGTAFTYQGQLNGASGGVTGLYDFRFAVYDASSGGTQIGGTINTNAVAVVNGLFTVTLDFGANIFTGNARWLDLAAHTNNSPNPFVSMTPRQQLTPTPYAIYAATSAGVSGLTLRQVAGTDASDLIAGSVSNAIDAGVRGSVIAGGGTGVTSLTNHISSDFSSIGGGDGNIIQAGANNSFIGGGGNNVITNGSYFSVIVGGSLNSLGNSDQYSFIGGGLGNHVDSASGVLVGGSDNNLSGGGSSFMGGGINNHIISASESFLGGGNGNTIQQFDGDSVLVGGIFNSVGGKYSALVGGQYNTNNGQYASLGGGYSNLVTLNGNDATVSGGNQNTASGYGATVSGGDNNIASGSWSTIGGGQGNIASNQHGTIGGGEFNTNNNQDATIGGGKFNSVSGVDGTVSGGAFNQATNDFASVPGGYENLAGGKYSFAAGQQAQATNNGAFVWADSQNTPFRSTNNDSFNVRAQGGVHFVTGGAGLTLDGVPLSAGGINGITVQQNPGTGAPNIIEGSPVNTVSSGVVGATIGGGGASNYNASFGTGQFINGVTADFGTVGGGAQNQAQNQLATVAGGLRNTANGFAAVVAGGEQNTASGTHSMVPGGNFNTASGQSSFAAGRQAQATNDGSFVWADSQGAAFSSTNNDSFNVRAQGGVHFVTSGAGATVDGATVATTANTLTIRPDFSVVAGGLSNNVPTGTADSFIGGGLNNTNRSGQAFIGGGNNNTIGPSASAGFIAGGSLNAVNNQWATVLGGVGNQANGVDSLTLGGFENIAGGTASLAAGYQAQALNNTTFVWADQQGTPFASTADNQFLVRAEGGVGIDTASTPDGGLAVNTNIHINEQPLYLRSGTDHNHGLAYSGTTVTNFGNGNAQVDGPVLWGNAGGALGIASGGQRPIVTWGPSGATVYGNLVASNTPAVNWDQNNSEDIFIPNSAEFVISTVSSSFPAGGGVLVLSGSVSVDANEDLGTGGSLDIYDVTDSGNPVRMARIDAAANYNNVPVSWTVSLSALDTKKIYQLQFLANAGDAHVYAHSFNIMYFPRQNN